MSAGTFVANAISSSPVTPVTNAQKLSLPVATPVGTQVSVTDSFTIEGCGTPVCDGFYYPIGTMSGRPQYQQLGGTVDQQVFWDGAQWNIQGLALELEFTGAEDVAFPWLVGTWTESSGTLPVPITNPVMQQLAAPSASVTAYSVLGGGSPEYNGIYTVRGTSAGKPYYNLLGKSNDSASFAIGWDGINWYIADNASGIAYQGTGVAIATPDLVPLWLNTDDNPINTGLAPSPTVSAVTQGELDAGVLVTGAGTVAANGAQTVSGNAVGFTKYGTVSNGVMFGGSDWDVVGDDLIYRAAPAAFPWNLTYSPDDADPPAPTVVRDDVASESNWDTI